MEGNSVLAFALGVAKLPGSLAYLALRLLNKKETLGTALQRLGWSSTERRHGPVLWFNVNGIGETSTVLPVVYRCLQEYNEKVTVLVTTPCLEVYKLLVESLPQRVLVQLVPMANPITISAFLRKWQPQVGVFLETPFHRELVLMARESGVRLALLNAHMPGEEMLEWHARRTSREMLKQALSSYSLIVPRTYVDVGRFRMFGATLGQMPGWSTDLQQASELGACATRLLNQRPKICRSLLKRLAKRQVWIAANTLPGEDVVVARIHAALRSRHKGLLTLVAPRVIQPAGSGIASVTNSHNSAAYTAAARRVSAQKRLKVELLSVVVHEPERLTPDLDVLVLDDSDALTTLYSLSEVVLVGGSLLPSLDGASSPAAAAVAGCALLMGPHGAEFLGMASDLNHAAIMASDEVAAAVAQTGATMRGINPAGFDTPREGREPEPGREGNEGGGRSAAVAPRAGGLGSLASNSVDCGGAVDAGVPGSSGPTWQQLVTEAQRPARSSRPMSAPPTVPEHFGLRPVAPTYGLSPLGGHMGESSFHPGSNGHRNFLMAPFSTPGMTYGFGEVGSPAHSPAQPASLDFTTLASAPTACGTTGHRRRRRAIDRFRWASSRDVVGFGYTQDVDSDEVDSASSTSESEEGEREGADARDAREARPTAATLASGASRQSNQDAAAMASPVGSGSVRSVARSLHDLQVCPGSGAASAVNSSGQEVSTVDAGAGAGAAAAFHSPMPLHPSPGSPRRSGMSAEAPIWDDVGGSEMDDSEFHDAMEAEPVGEELSQQTLLVAPVAAPAQDTHAAADTASASVVAGITPDPGLLEHPEGPALDACRRASHGRVSDEDDSSVIQHTSPKDAPIDKGRYDTSAVPAAVGGSIAALELSQALDHADDSGEISARSLRQPQSTERNGFDLHVSAHSLSGLSSSTCNQDDSSSVAAAGEYQTSRGTHLGHLVICKDSCGDGDDNGQESEWPKRLGLREARHLVSDPGLPSDLLPTCFSSATESCGLSIQWPVGPASADAAKSSLAPASACVGPAGSKDSSLGCTTRVLNSHGIQSAAPRAAEPNLPGLDDATLTDSWVDVNMSTIFEDEGAFPSEPALVSTASQPSSATATRETSAIWGDSPQPSFRGSLDHYLQSVNQQALLGSPPSASRGRAARGAMTRMVMRMPVANVSMTNLMALCDTAAAEQDKSGAPDMDQAREEVGHGEDAAVAPVDNLVDGGLGDGPNSGALLPLPPRVTVAAEAAGMGDGDADLDGSSSEPSPTIVPAVTVVADIADAEIGSSPTSIVNPGGVSGSDSTAAALLGTSPATDAHPACAAESPRSDFEFGGSVPDDTGSGSPTLLATASVHNGSGANLQAYISGDGQEAGAQQVEAVHPLGAALASAQTGLPRPNSRTSSPSSTNSWSDGPPTISPTRNGSPGVQPTRFQGPRLPVQAPLAGSGVVDSSPYNAGSCFAGQTCFNWLPEGSQGSAVPPAGATSARSRSVSGSGGDGTGAALPPVVSSDPSTARGACLSTAVSAASIGSRSSTGFHQVASIGSWLDHFGSMLPQPSPGLQRSQAQHDPMVWFSQQLGQRDDSSGVPAQAVALEGIAPGLRAPMHSPLRAFDDDRGLSFNPQALASVTTTLFPAAHVALSCPAPLPPPATGALSPRRAAVSGSPLRPASSVSSEQITSAFTVGKSQYSTAAGLAASSAGSAFSLPSPARSRVEPAVPTAEIQRVAKQTDELSALLNSPRSPVSPVRIARVVSPVMDRRNAQVTGGALTPPARTGAVGGLAQVDPLSAIFMSPSQPKERSSQPSMRHSTSEGCAGAANTANAESWPLPVALPSINTPRRELQRRLSAPVRRPSPASSPLRSTLSVVPGAAVLTVAGAPTATTDAALAGWQGSKTYSAATAPCPVYPRAGGFVGMSPISSTFVMGAGSPAPDGLQSPDSDGSSSCPNTPTSRAADNASSPFRGPRPVQQPPKSPNFHSDPERFEESFEAAARAGPAKSPARPAGSVHVSPLSSPYKSPFAGTAFRSLYLDEEEELAAGQARDEASEDAVPLSPRANSHNVLFSMQALRDDDPSHSPPAAGRNTIQSRVSPGAGPLPAVLLPPLLPSRASAAAALPSVFAQQMPPRRHRLSYGSGGGTTGLLTASGDSLAFSPFLTRNLDTEAEAETKNTGAEVPTLGTNPIQMAEAASAAAAADKDGAGAVHLSAKSASHICLDKAPTFSRIPSLTDTDEEEGSATASTVRTFPGSMPARQPRITLSGGPLVVPAVAAAGGSSGSGPLPKSNLSQAIIPRCGDYDDDDAEENEPSMELPDVTINASTASGEAPRAQPSRSAEGSRSGSCSSIASGNHASGGVARGVSAGVTAGGFGQQQGGSAAGGISGHGSADSLASSAAVVTERDGSPPRSPADRTRCSQSNCPSASPVKPLLHSTQSSPVPRSFASEGSHGPPRLPYMPALPSQQSPRSPTSPPMLSPRASTSGGVPHVPFSLPASYASPKATDPRASPIKVMSVVKRTPGPAYPHEDKPDDAVAASTAAFFASFSPSTSGGLASSMFGVSGNKAELERASATSAAAPGLGHVAPVRTQPSAGAPPSPTAAAASLAPTVFSRPGPAWPPRQEPWAGSPANDELLLSTRASAPAGFAALADRGLPPTPRHFGRRDVQPTLSPQSSAARQSHDLHVQRTQQQQAWDRARAESRNASAAGTPRSARALFSGRDNGRDASRDSSLLPLPVSFSSSTCGFTEVCVSPVEAPRSPRLRTSPTRPPVFALDAAVVGQSALSGRDALAAAAEEAWEVQQARHLHPYHAASLNGTPRSARVLFPPMPSSGGGGAADQFGGAMEPPSPSWSNVSRRLFPEGGYNTAGTATPDRRSVDHLDEFLTNMTVQVASPVSPQPRLPPPPASPRLTGGTPSGGRHGTVETAPAATSGSASSAARRSASTSKRPSSPLLQTALLQQARKTSASGEQDASQRVSPQRNANQPAYGSPGSTSQPGPQRTDGGGAKDSGAQPQSVPALPHLPPLPPLPRLRHSPGVHGASGSAVPGHGPSSRWPLLAHPLGMGTTPGAAQDADSDASSEAEGRRPFRQSAPELSHAYGPMATSPGAVPPQASTIPLPGMPPKAEQEALAALESQFTAAEQEAADLPIETRVATPTALPAPSGTAGGDGSGAFAHHGYRPNTAPDYRPVAPPSPRALTAASGPTTASNGPSARGANAADMLVELKPPAQTGGSGAVGENRANGGVAQGQTGMAAACDGPSGSSKMATHGATTDRGPSGIIRPALGPAAPSPTPAPPAGARRLQDEGSQRYGQGCMSDVGGNVPRGMLQSDAAAPSTLPRSASQHPVVATPSRGAVGGSPIGSIGGAHAPDRELYVAPCARYGGQYLIPAAHLTCDSRVGPAVWMVSNEDELAAALSTLLRDPIERRSRGRAAAQGAAKLASSLVTTVWSVLEDMVIAPALQEYITSGEART